MTTSIVILKPDMSELEGALAQLAQLPQERLKLFFDLFNLGTEFICVNLEGGPTRGTGEVRVRFQPSDLLRDFLAASRAGDGQVNIIE